MSWHPSLTNQGCSQTGWVSFLTVQKGGQESKDPYTPVQVLYMWQEASPVARDVWVAKKTTVKEMKGNMNEMKKWKPVPTVSKEWEPMGKCGFYI